MSKIDEFLLNYNKKFTIKSYRSILNKYFRIINVKNVDNYFKGKRNYEADIKKYWQKQQNEPPNTRNAGISCVRTFLGENGIVEDGKTLPYNYIKKLKGRATGKRSITEMTIPTQKEIAKILQYCDLKEKALVLVLSSSGIRIGESLQLVEEDFHFDENPVRIEIRASITKTNESRCTFISDEASESVKAWLDVKQDYLKQAVAKCTITDKGKREGRKTLCTKSLDDPRVFCFSYFLAKELFTKALRKAKLNERDRNTSRRWHKIHLHQLRKYFRIYISPKATSDVAEVLMGHRDSLGNVYRDYHLEQLRTAYLNGVKDLQIFERSADLSEVNEQLKKKDQQIKELEDRMQRFEDLLEQKKHLLNLYENQLKIDKK